MVKTKRTKGRGQSTAEYAIVIAIVLGAAIAMQTYVRRSLQDRVADGSDQLPQIDLTNAGIPFNAILKNRNQVEPLYASSKTDANTNITGNVSLAGASGNASAVTYDAATTSNRTGLQLEAGAN